MLVTRSANLIFFLSGYYFSRYDHVSLPAKD